MKILIFEEGKVFSERIVIMLEVRGSSVSRLKNGKLSHISFNEYLYIKERNQWKFIADVTEQFKNLIHIREVEDLI